jgi:hypothetical protein
MMLPITFSLVTWRISKMDTDDLEAFREWFHQSSMLRPEKKGL